MTLALLLGIELIIAGIILVFVSPCWRDKFARRFRKAGRPREIQPDCDAIGPTHIPKWVGLVWLLWGWSTFGRDLALLVLGRMSWTSWHWYGLIGWALFGLADMVLAAHQRWQLAQFVVDIFELDEVLLPAVKTMHADTAEPHRAAYMAARGAAYDYIALVTWGHRPCEWRYSFRTLPFGTGTGWQVPRYPWLQAVGGPALLEIDTKLLLVTERLDEPVPAPLFPGPVLRQPRCVLTRRPRHPQTWPQTVASPFSVEWDEAEGQDEAKGWVEAGDQAGYTAALVPYARFNAVLPKFGRVRYPVLVRLRPERTQPKTILVRTYDGIPLQLPQVEVTFELFAQGRLVRDAFKELPPQQARALAWQAVHRLIQREAAHWRVHTATDLPRRVMESALDSTIRKVFAKYTAAQLLDRVHQKTLRDLLTAWPPEVGHQLKQRFDTYLKREAVVTPEQIRREILEAFNGPAEEGFPLAEQRGLKVVDITFGDWAPPRGVREILRQALRASLIAKGEELPSQIQARMQREFLAAAEHFLRRAEDLLPVLSLDEWTQAWSSPNDALRVLCRAWRRLLDETLLRTLPPHLEPPALDRPTLNMGDTLPRLTVDDLDTDDFALRERYLAQWLYEAYLVLQNCMPGTHPAFGPRPSQVLPDDPESV